MAGGDADPNVARLLRRLAARGMDHLALLAGASASPRLAWRLDDDALLVDGAAVRPTALFLRHDVFAHLADGGRPESRARAGRWYQAVLSWALAHGEVAFLNRAYGARQATKPHVLHSARRLGLAVPETLVTSDPGAFGPAEAAARWVAKPVNGGEHTRPLDEALADEAWRRRCSAEPVIVQRRLVGPELRIYRVGERWFAFALRSAALDYRTDPKVEVASVPAPAALTAPLGRLMDGLGLDFGAADFKACPETGRPLFLEVNSAPMFAGFDRVARGALCDAILDRLAVGARAAGAAA